LPQHLTDARNLSAGGLQRFVLQLLRYLGQVRVVVAKIAVDTPKACGVVV
jgi:hypothetical protein